MPDDRITSPLSKPLILSLYLPTLLLSICNGLLVPILPVFATAMDVSYLLVGLILAGDSIGMLLADLPAGALLQQIGRKRAMILGLAIAGGSVAALAFTDNATLVVALRIIAGAGAALFNLSRHVYMAEEIPRAGRGRAIALFGGTNRFGDFAGPLAGGFLGAAAGLGSVFILYGALAGATLLLCWRYVEGRIFRGAGEAVTPGEHGFAALRDTARSESRALLTAGTGQLAAMVVRIGRRVLIPLWAVDVLGLGVESVGILVSVANALDFALFYVAGIIMDRYGRKYAIVPSFLVQSISLLLLPLTTDFRSLLLVAGLGGFGNGIGSGTMLTLGADLAPEGRTAEFLGVWRLIGDVGSAGAPLLIGGVAQLLGLGPSVLVIGIIGAWGTGLFAFRVPETLSRRQRRGPAPPP